MAEKDADARLYAEFLDGDQRALEQLVTLHGDALTRFAYCIVQDDAAAEDVTADTFAVLIVKRKNSARVQNSVPGSIPLRVTGRSTMCADGPGSAP